jgi:hypothetical protein
MSRLWRPDGTTVEIKHITAAAGGGESHHSIFGWANDTKESTRTERSTSQDFFSAACVDGQVPAAGVPLNSRNSTFKLSDGYNVRVNSTTK